MRACVVWAAVAAVAAGGWAGEPGTDAKPEAGRKPRYGPRDVEVRLQDGSQIRGEILGLETVTLKTSYGALAFPITKILNINRGRRLPAEDGQEISAAIKNLDNDGYTIRAAAQQKLETCGAAAANLLRAARESASAEARPRIDALLKKIAASGAPPPQAADAVKAEEFEAQGELQFESFTVRSRLGDLQVKVQDVELVRWLARGSQKTMELEANAGLQDWVDTGIDGVGGDRLAVACSGALTMFGSGNWGPAGNAGWGGRGRPFAVGAVLGRLGANGKPFAIGAGKQWVAESNDRLFVRIYCPDDMRNRGDFGECSGQFSLRLASGAWADELSVPAGP